MRLVSAPYRRGIFFAIVLAITATTLAPQQAQAHDFSSWSRDWVYRGGSCQGEQGNLNHLSGDAIGYSVLIQYSGAPCDAHVGFFRPAGWNIIAIVAWKNGDGRGGGQMCYNSGWILNPQTSTQTPRVKWGKEGVGPIHWGNVCGGGPMKVTLDIHTHHYWEGLYCCGYPAGYGAGWRGGIKAPAGTHYYD